VEKNFMFPIKKLTLLTMIGLLMAACQPGSPIPVTATSTPIVVATDTPVQVSTPTETATAIVAETETPTPQASPSPTAGAPERPEEAILIQVPGPGSQVTSPIRVAGVADPTFEQTLVVRVLLADGTELTQVPAMIQADVGQRGPFEVEVPVDLNEQANLFIQVFVESARDGGTTHLSSMGVTFSPEGLENIFTREPHPEQIAIFAPENGETVSGGVAHVEGFGLATFEQTLLIEILDDEGNLMGAESVIVQAPDLGQPGPYRADVAYTVTEPGPGRVVVRDVSPAFGGNTHLNSIEINLEP
jgi:hypothetical protein